MRCPWPGAHVNPVRLHVEGRALLKGAVLLVFFEMGLRLTDRQVRLRTGRKMLQASRPCAPLVFAAVPALHTPWAPRCRKASSSDRSSCQ